METVLHWSSLLLIACLLIVIMKRFLAPKLRRKLLLLKNRAMMIMEQSSNHLELDELELPSQQYLNSEPDHHYLTPELAEATVQTMT
jgi:hypothetical protein